MTLNLLFQLVIGCRTSSHTLTNKRVSPLQDRKEENGGGHYARDIELTSASSDSHRPPRMNNGSLIGAGSESSGQSSSRMSQQTDSSGNFYNKIFLVGEKIRHNHKLRF